MDKFLKIGKGRNGLSLPLDFVTKTQGILARKRSGKSYTAQKQAEQLLKHGQQIAALDPTGAWWGLRSSADGKHEGFPVVVFGGEHEDAPLEPTSGKAMAAALVEHGFSAVYDVSLMLPDEQVQFATAFCHELFRLNRKPMHFFIDEADVFAPQKTLGKSQEKCLDAVKRLVKMGGIRGIGCTMITQRAAVISKDVLSQVDILTVLRMSLPHDVAIAVEWIAAEVSPEFSKKVKAELPGLPTGTAFFCSALLGLGERVEVAPKETFNSGRTPKPGELVEQPKVMARIDIVKLGAEIAASAKKVLEESPEFLKKKIAELEAQVAKGGKQDMGFLEEAQAAQARIHELERIVESLESELAALRERDALWTRTALQISDQLAEFNHQRPAERQAIYSPPPQPLPPPNIKAIPSQWEGLKMAKAPRTILNVLAQFGESTKSRLAAISGYAVNGGGFNNALSACRSAGWAEGSDPLRITPAGRAALGPVSPLPRGRELLTMWQAKLGKAEREILGVLAKHKRMQKDTVAAMLNYAANGGGFNNALSSLRTLELITGSRELSLTPDFAEAIGGSLP